jgi:dolichyl-phosphate beta-glucosyltransferase
VGNPFRLSVVVPAYNEEKRIGHTLGHMVHFLKSQPYTSEIIVVDDGSQDQTVSLSRQKLAQFPHKVIENAVNRGKGSAVKQGMLAATGDYILFSDADMSTPIEEINRFFPLFLEGFDCVIGSRALKDSKLEIRQNALREFIGRVFNRLARLLSFRGISDSQCGFKCFTRKAAHDLFQRQKLDGFSFDAEILFLAQKHGYKICEQAVLWKNDAQSRVQILRDPLLMFRDLLKIRWLHR